MDKKRKQMHLTRCKKTQIKMKIVKPYIDENKQIIFVELENETLHNVINGMILGLLTILPIALITPKPL